MTRVDENGWARDSEDRKATLPEIHVVTGADLLDAAEAFVRASRAADTYGSDPDPYLVHAAYASQTRLQQGAPGAQPEGLMEGDTEPLDEEGEDVDLSDPEAACDCGGASDDRDHSPSCAGWAIARGDR